MEHKTPLDVLMQYADHDTQLAPKPSRSSSAQDGTDADNLPSIDELQTQIEDLTKQLQSVTDERDAANAEVERLTLEFAMLETSIEYELPLPVVQKINATTKEDLSRAAQMINREIERSRRRPYPRKSTEKDDSYTSPYDKRTEAYRSMLSDLLE